MVFQDPNYQLCRETVEDELRISFPKETPKELVRIGISEILKDLELSGTEDRQPLSLSGGQKQRLAIGCAIASRRNQLLDEPTSGLDYTNMKALSILLKKLSAKKKITVIVVTHDVEFIYSCCNRHIQLAYKQS
jgi:energy-coupling factor transport system ATP-binding protein